MWPIYALAFPAGAHSLPRAFTTHVGSSLLAHDLPHQLRETPLAQQWARYPLTPGWAVDFSGDWLPGDFGLGAHEVNYRGAIILRRTLTSCSSAGLVATNSSP